MRIYRKFYMSTYKSYQLINFQHYVLVVGWHSPFDSTMTPADHGPHTSLLLAPMKSTSNCQSFSAKSQSLLSFDALYQLESLFQTFEGSSIQHQAVDPTQLVGISLLLEVWCLWSKEPSYLLLYVNYSMVGRSFHSYNHPTTFEHSYLPYFSSLRTPWKFARERGTGFGTTARIQHK